MKILITGGKSAQALKVLKAFAQHEVILADYGDVPSLTAGNVKFISLGERNDEIIAHSLLNSCLDQGVEVVLPIQSFEIEPIAKANILYSEFEIAVLLPRMEELAMYFNPQIPVKSADWILFINGEVLFSTYNDAELVALGRQSKLNGLFYVNKAEAVANLELFTI